MKCPRCHIDMEMQTVTELKQRSIIQIIILLCIPVVGWAILIMYLLKGRKSQTVTYAVCPKCGRRRRR